MASIDPRASRGSPPAPPTTSMSPPTRYAARGRKPMTALRGRIRFCGCRSRKMWRAATTWKVPTTTVAAMTTMP